MKSKFEKKCVGKSILLFILTAMTLFTFGCVPPTTNTNINVNAISVNANTNTSAAPVTAEKNNNPEMKMPVTLPVLDAMFTDETFAGDLKSKLQLTDEQIDKIKKTAREAVVNLGDDDTESDSRSTREATERANNQIRELLGDEKAAKLFDLVRERWSNGSDEADVSASKLSSEWNKVPTDTRIVVNAPSYRMDLFQDGKLIKTYKIGIGYPEFPLPVGMRQAKTIIFNPTWTPPDEPWVKGKLEAGKTIEAGSAQNPLGPIKIPIGLPSLIHGGKSAAKLGGFASHGCVGLTNSQIQDFAMNLAKLSGNELTQQDVKGYEKQKTETKNVDLEKSIPVELRYETIVVEGGKLNIYRDVYERGTNTEENLRRVLENYGVSFDNLKEQDRDKILKGLKQMAYNAKGESFDKNNKPEENSNSNAKFDNSNSKNKNSNTEDVEITRNIKGKKQISFDVAELKGKGYPAPVEISQK
ncbi:MAG: L,D-transpeptidase [Acidobacteria bacterium]|nr:L,D-transpeptidase [Acidobacteriota bacterium]